MQVVEIFPYKNLKTKIRIIKALEKRQVCFKDYPEGNYIYAETSKSVGGKKNEQKKRLDFRNAKRDSSMDHATYNCNSCVLKRPTPMGPKKNNLRIL